MAATNPDLNHPRIRSVKKQIEWQDGKWNHVLVIATDVRLDTFADDYDSAAVNELVDSVGTALGKARAGFHKVKIEEV